MDRSRKMSETESEIMEVLWNSEAPMSAAELIDYFAEQRGKVWKAPTLATFLSGGFRSQGAGSLLSSNPNAGGI